VTEYAVSIRELAEFCYRRGDIDHRFAPSPTGVQGTEGHQRVFRRRPKTYQSEFPVEYQHRHEGLLLNVRGRADGYDAQAGLVEEIKTCRVNPQSIASSVVYVHLAYRTAGAV
jgi:DNA excision repair protein ERCC-2